jgi:hypothetical protein
LELLPTAAEREVDRVFALALAPEVLDDAPFPIGLPITLTFGLDTEDDCDPEEFIAVELLLEPEFEV